MFSSMAYSPPPPPPPPNGVPSPPAPPPPAPHASTLSTWVTPAGAVQLLDPAVVNSVTVENAEAPGAAWMASADRAVPITPGIVYQPPRGPGDPVDVADAWTRLK